MKLVIPSGVTRGGGAQGTRAPPFLHTHTEHFTDCSPSDRLCVSKFLAMCQQVFIACETEYIDDAMASTLFDTIFYICAGLEF